MTTWSRHALHRVDNGNARDGRVLPARTAATTARKSAREASGRAASCTTTTSASSGTRARPARTDSGTGCAADSDAHTFGRRPLLVRGQYHDNPVTRLARDSDRAVDDGHIAETRELLRGAEPRSASGRDDDRPRLHADSLAQTAHNRAGPTPRLGIFEPGEQQAPRGRRYDRRHLQHHFRTTDELVPAVHDDHRTVVEVTDALAGLLAFARDRDPHVVAGPDTGRQLLRELAEVRRGDAL